PQVVQWHCKHKNGRLFWAEVSLKRARIGDDDRLLAIIRDVSDRMQDQESLRESEEKYKALFEYAGDASFIMDVSEEHGARFLDCNERTLELFGCTHRDQIVGKSPVDFSPPRQPDGQESIEKASKLAGAVMEGRPQRFEWEHCRPDGTTFWVEVALNRIDLEGKPFMQAIVHDITEHKEAEEALAESEGRFRALYEQAAVGVSQVETKTGRYLKVNRKYCDIVGYSPEEMMSRSFQEITHPEDLPKDLDNMKKLLQGDIREFGMEKRYLHKSGEIVWVSLSVSAMWGAGEEPNWHIAVVEDITERRGAEESLRENEERWRSLTSNTNDIILILDIEGNILYTNRVYPPHEMKNVAGHSIFEFMSEESNEVTRESIKKLLRGEGPQTLETAVRLSESDTAHFEVKYVPMLANGEVDKIIAVAKDITERKQVEEARQESELRFRQLVENVREVFWMENAEGTELLYVSPAYEQIWGRSCQEFYENPKVWLEAIHPDDRQRVEDAFSKRRNDGTYSEEFRIVRPDGSVRWIWDRGVLIHDDSGNLYRVAGIAEDITERARAEEALKESEEKYRMLIENTDAVINFFDAEGRFVFLNSQSAKNLGKKVKDIIGKSIYDVFPEVADFHMQSFTKIMNERKGALFEDLFELPDEKRWFSSNLQPVIDKEGNVRGVQIVSYDITERKQAEEQLRSSEEKYRVLFEGHAEPVTILDRDGIVLMVNSAGARNIGMSQEESVGKSIFEVLPSIDDSLHEVYQQVIDTGISVTREDFLELPSGHRWFWSVHQPVSDINGTRYGVQIISYDITERKRAEAERERLMEELEATNKELQSIVYTTSHDLQTPLVNIKGFGGELGKYCGQLNALLESKTAGKDTAHQIETLLNEDIPEAIKFINAGTDKMRSLLDGLMYLSRVGEDRLNVTGLDMNQLVKNVQRTMKYQIKEKGATVAIEKLPECMGDARQIDQVFSNLLDNALKYLEAGRKGEIRISGVVEKDMSIYCVEDNGIGIAPEHREKIFEIFYRLDPAAPSAGEGLGLTIVERILDRNSGLIQVESEVGKGSKFFVSLPHAKLSKQEK
ncbi:MAG: PAS domain S-box protein, partial [Planctomycetota bacterium]